jgi:hypothetical protein
MIRRQVIKWDPENTMITSVANRSQDTRRKTTVLAAIILIATLGNFR